MSAKCFDCSLTARWSLLIEFSRCAIDWWCVVGPVSRGVIGGAPCGLRWAAAGLVVLLRVEVAVLALGPAVVAQEAVDRAALFLRGATVEVLEEESCEGERRSGELQAAVYSPGMVRAG